MGCSLSPGMHMNSSNNGSNEYIYIESIDKRVEVLDINTGINKNFELTSYKIGVGDEIAITVWGLPDVFPMVNMSPDQNLRKVDADGMIFFPYIGMIKAIGRTQTELRNEITDKLSVYFTDPQIDVSVARFYSQKVYILGEVTIPQKIFIAQTPISLSDAIGEASGLNTNTSNGSEVFIIRNLPEPIIYRADLSSPSGFLLASNFYLSDNDVIYINASGTTRWNRVISQFFPFSTFLNSIDNLVKEN